MKAAEAPLIFVVGARGVPDVEGGCEKNAEMLFPRIVDAGYRVTLIGLDRYIKADNFKGVQLIKAPHSFILQTDKLLCYVAALFEAVRLRPQIVHFQGLGSALFLWAYKLMGAKAVVRYGSADYVVGKWGMLGKLGFLLSEFQLRFADAIISVTPALAQRLAARGITRNVHIIANAIDTFPDTPEAIAPDAPYILTVGRVTAQKNVANLLRAYALLTEKPKLIVAGGLEEERYVSELRPLLTDGATLAGRFVRSAMPPLYKGAKLYVNASLHEGNSNAVLEAISGGCPILLSDIPENRDFGLPDRHYFDPGSPEAIAGAMACALENLEAYRVDPSRYLTWDMVATRTLEIYRRVAPIEDVRVVAPAKSAEEATSGARS